ncbi:MAG: ATP-binding protein, partial [Anaerolineae bacterium]
RDEAAEALRKKYAPKLARLQDRLRRAEQKLEKQVAQAQKAKIDTAISFGATLLSAFAGRKVLSSTTVSKASTAMRGVTRTMNESQDIEQAKEDIESIKQQIAALDAEFQQEVAALEERIDPMTEELQTLVIKPRKTDINIELLTLVWAPFFESGGNSEAAW